MLPVFAILLLLLSTLTTTTDYCNAAEDVKKPARAAAAAQQTTTGTSKTGAAKEFEVENVQFAVYNADSGQPASSDMLNLTPGVKLATRQTLDPQKKLLLTFRVKDKATGTAITVHQAFVLLVHEQSRREIIYVAEPDKSSKLYTFDLDMKTQAKDFSGVGGLYSIHLLLADFSSSSPLQWHFADLDLQQLPSAPAEPSQQQQVPKSSRINYQVLPEIHHQFRTSEPRPPAIVSDTFAAICAAPLLILLILWFRIGPNLGNLKLSIWALGFHAGLCSIFGLYVCYWLQLDMFQTLKWLAVLGVPTLICGNRLLLSFSVASGGAAKSKKQ